MPDITIRDIPDLELDALQQRAERHGRSLEDEARHLLHEAAAEQLLVMDLERATAAVEARLRAAHAPATVTGRAAGAAGGAPASQPSVTDARPRASRRRRVRYEPTPGSR
jgi:plasmid stability protein